MDKIVLKSTLERLVGYIKAAISGKADASELKDVKKQVENKADLVDGKVPLAQLGNIDTQVMLVVDKLPNTDIKANKIYLVKNTDSTEEQNVYTEYVYVNWKWEKLGEFKPEVDLSHIEQKLDTKADVSAIPTKVSQLTNDAKFIAPHTNPVLSGLTVTSNAKIKFIQKSGGSEGTYLVAETVADRVANKVYAADGSLFDVSKLVKRVRCNISGDINNIEFGYTTVDGTYNFSVIPTVTTKHGGIMSPADKVKLDKLQELVELKIVGTSESSVAMKPNKVYEITVGSALTITLEEPTDKTVYNEYQGTFDTGDTIPTVTFPSNVRWNDTPKVGANQHVEFSIRYSGGNYYGICQVWDMTTEQSV